MTAPAPEHVPGDPVLVEAMMEHGESPFSNVVFRVGDQPTDLRSLWVRSGDVHPVPPAPAPPLWVAVRDRDGDVIVYGDDGKPYEANPWPNQTKGETLRMYVRSGLAAAAVLTLRAEEAATTSTDDERTTLVGDTASLVMNERVERALEEAQSWEGIGLDFTSDARGRRERAEHTENLRAMLAAVLAADDAYRTAALVDGRFEFDEEPHESITGVPGYAAMRQDWERHREGKRL